VTVLTLAKDETLESPLFPGLTIPLRQTVFPAPSAQAGWHDRDDHEDQPLNGGNSWCIIAP
jgi:hypothetical protein